jgi:hypothetical protein
MMWVEDGKKTLFLRSGEKQNNAACRRRLAEEVVDALQPLVCHFFNNIIAPLIHNEDPRFLLNHYHY